MAGTKKKVKEDDIQNQTAKTFNGYEKKKEQSVTDDLVTGKTNAQQVTPQTPPENVNAEEGYTPVVKTQESQNDGQPGDNINNPVEATTTTTTTTTTNEEAPAVQPGSKEDFVNQSVGDKDVAAKIYDDKQKGFADYGMTRDEYDVALSDPQYARTQGWISGDDDNKLQAKLDAANAELGKNNLTPARRSQILAHKAAIVAEQQKRKKEGTEVKSEIDKLWPDVKGEEKTAPNDANPQGGKVDTTEGDKAVEDGKNENNDVVGADTDKEPEYTNRKQDKTDDTATSTVNGDTGTGTDTNKGGASNGTENDGQLAGGTTSTDGDSDKNAENLEKLKNVTGKNKQLWGSDGKPLRNYDTIAKDIESGKDVPLEERYAYAKEKEAKASQDGNDKLTEQPSEDNIIKVLRANGADEHSLEVFKDVYKKYPEAFDIIYKDLLGTKKEKESLVPPEMDKLPDLPTVEDYKSQRTIDLEEALKSAKEKSKLNPKQERARKILAGIGDVIAHVANIWSVSRGANAMQIGSLSEANAKRRQADEAKATAAIDKANKELAESIKDDRTVSLKKTENAFNAWAKMVSAIQKKYELDGKTFIEKLKAAEGREKGAIAAMFKIIEKSVPSVSIIKGEYKSHRHKSGGTSSTVRHVVDGEAAAAANRAQ